MNKGIALGCLLLLSGCTRQSIIKKKISICPTRTAIKNKIVNSPEKYPPITIWVHGTRIIRRPLYYSFFGGAPCFRKAKDLDRQYHLRQVADILSSNNPNLFPMQTYYLFGWSGKLNESVREDAARAFHKGLQAIIEEYKKEYNQEPFIRVLCHSHGGNVLLSAAKIKNEFEKPITINELILFACPVQNSTMHCVYDNQFDQIYSFYSSLDIVQVIAPQIVYKASQKKSGKTRIAIYIPSFSDQRFPFCDKLMQVKIKMNYRSLFHGEFTIPPFISVFPQILEITKAWKDELNDHEQNATHLLCLFTKRDRPHRVAIA